MQRKLKLLIVEDETAILTGLVDLFVFHGYEVDSAQDGKQGLEKALVGDYDLIVLDVMLPSMDGFSICNELRKRSREQPIIMLTAKTSDDDIITGLTLGADDYVAKPFSVRELVLRVEAVLRRSSKIRAEEIELAVGAELFIDTQNLIGKRSGKAETIPFTRREIEILRYLKLHSSRPVSRDELLSEVWGYSKASHIETRTVDIHMAKLRRKVEPDPKNPTVLITIRGEGYKLIESGIAKDAKKP